MKGIETSLRICQSCSSKSIHNHIRRQSTSTLLNSRRITSNPISSTCNSSRSQSSSARPIDSDLFTSSTSSAYASQSSSSNSSNNQFSSSTSFPSPSSLTRTYGQPLPHTHPHLFPLRDAVGSPVLDPSGNVIPTPELELTPGISALEYEERRKRLMKRLPEGSIVVATAGRVKCMSANIFYRFRQESNFWYLTGFQEPDALLLLESKPSTSRGYKMTMFVSPRDEHNETWNGPRTGESGVKELFGADEAYPMESGTLLHNLKAILPKYSNIYVDPSPIPSIPRPTSRSSKTPSLLNFLSAQSPSSNGLDIFSSRSDFDTVVRLLGDTKKCHSLSKELDLFRVKKSPAEVAIMRRAGKASSNGMIAAMGGASKKGRTEMEVQAIFEFECSMNGGQRPAYVPVVAGGDRSLVIHYTNNDQSLKQVQQDNGLVCLDGGCELDGYASDITRAFPTNESGTFTKPQRDIYQAILNVLHQCTKLSTATQNLSLSELHRKSVEFLRLELLNLGFNLPSGHLERYLYPHYLGHWLGIDLHDSSTVQRSTRLEEGMVLTIEPALYIPIEGPGISGCPEEYRGIGIRIEDDVLVGKHDNIILSAEAPREIVDVEAACQQFLDSNTKFSEREREQERRNASNH